MVDFGKNDMMPHFIYCSGDFINFQAINFQVLKKLILKKMREYGIPSSILTMLSMYRINLITKEKSKAAAEGKLKNDPNWRRYEGSINDDLDLFVNNLQSSEEIDEAVDSFFTPKLTKEELKLVEQKNEEHWLTYLKFDPDVGIEEMKKSDSKDKYLHSYCKRITGHLTLESNQTPSSDSPSESSSDSSSDDLRSPTRKRIKR